MFLPYWYKPTGCQVQQFINQQTALALNYSQVGMTQTGAPAGFVVDHNRVQLGYGQATFDQACAALQRWRMFDLGWVELLPGGQSLAVGVNVAVLAKVGPIWFLNACRVVYTVDQASATGCRYGFAYGTLPGHAERGEERFVIEWQRTDDTVWYEILAYSQPNALLARLGYPLVRYCQKRFARHSKQRMQDAVGEAVSC